MAELVDRDDGADTVGRNDRARARLACRASSRFAICFGSHTKSCTVLFFLLIESDSVVAVSAVRKGRSSSAPLLRACRPRPHPAAGGPHRHRRCKARRGAP